VSESLFPQGVIQVQGFSWCKDKPKEIGMSGLTAKILCTRHNSDLSPVDDAGAKAFNVFREMRRIANGREMMKPRRWQSSETQNQWQSSRKMVPKNAHQHQLR